MKKLSRFALVFSFVLFLGLYLTASETNAQQKGKKGGSVFVDLNGDGICDNFTGGYGFDDDGDGIPNGQDDDYVKPQDGTGKKLMKGKAFQNKVGKGGYGPGDGTGNNSVGPQDGTGFGANSGVCDGTGPKGNRNRNNK
jgi:hypothetical protein